MRNLDPLVGRIDVVAAQKAGHVVARVMHAPYDKHQSGLCLISGMGMSAIRKSPCEHGEASKTGTIPANLSPIFFVKQESCGYPRPPRQHSARKTGASCPPVAIR